MAQVSHVSKTLPGIPGELAHVLFCTSQLNSSRDVEFELSSTSTLLGFITAQTPWGKWLSKYFDTQRVNLDAMMTSRQIDQTMMMGAGSGTLETADKPWVVTEYMSYLLDDALKYQTRISTDSQLDERHLLAAYVYGSDYSHGRQLAEWGIDSIGWSNSFLAEIALRNADELDEWVKVHRETFSNDPVLGQKEQEKQAYTFRARHQSTSSSADTDDKKPPAEEPSFIQDQTHIHLDGPATKDGLGRKHLAASLAFRMNRTWLHRDENLKHSFMLHIDGAWGSGKSSLLNFLKVELQPHAPQQGAKQASRKVEEGALDWIVVDFNAWQRQHVEPPWWALIDTVYTQAVHQLENLYGEHVHAWKLRFREHWWRIKTSRRDVLVALSISFLILVGVAFWYRRDQGGLNLIQTLLTFLGVAGGVWSTVLLVSRSLISGSSQSAQAFMQRSGDPMERVSQHFIDLIQWINNPVVIFVDDLDRCQTEYVVTLLEGIQTLFNNRRVVYIIAADRRWLHISFEKAYEHFANAVKEPGRHLGSLFLDKAFDGLVSLPRLSPDQIRIYLEYLGAGGQANAVKIETFAAESQNEFKDDTTEAAVLKRLSTGTGNPLRDEVRKGVALRQLARQDVAKSTEYFLKPFERILEPNPRAIKRFMTAYSFLRDFAVLGGSNVLFDLNARRQLALWAIVSLRWPLLKEWLEEHLQEYPEDDVIKLICEELPVPIDDPEIQQLLRSPEVIRVFKGGAIGTGLDKETICSLVGISTAQPKSGGVA